MLHVLLGATCNNNCLFCMEADRAARAAHVTAQSREDIRAMISSYGSRDEVLFTSGEPTQETALLDHVVWAREEGFRVIGVISNGRRLSYPGIARELVDAGVNRVTISIHGHTARLHDRQTRTPGSFQQTLAGLDNILRLRRSRTLEVHTATVISQRTLDQAQQIHAFLARRDPDLMVFNVMMPVGRGARRLTSLMPRYAQVADAFVSLAAGLPPQKLRQLRLVDLPLCVGRDLPFPLWGEPERFEQYERAGSSGLSGRSLQRDPRGAPKLLADGSYYVTGRALKDSTLRVKEEPCQGCAAEPLCPGVYRSYSEAFGHDELRPFTAARLAKLGQSHGKKRRRSVKILED